MRVILARMAELDDDPVIARLAAPASFPTIAHVDAATRRQQPVQRAVMGIGIGNDTPAIQCRCEIDFLICGDFGPIAPRLTINPQARYAAIGVDM